ncbi:MAG: PQQ-dependent dehydrogenase, methanol/ethanol family, partial [Sinobacteraceae bacterium]|nr:PQQ-dependent dehydrogenase, methanol/ethanol family [Nevskiaceae bacterium]
MNHEVDTAGMCLRLARSLAVTVLAACSVAMIAQAATQPSTATIRKATRALDDATIIANQAKTKHWPTYGLGFDSARFSKLKQVDADNVHKLGLAWSFDLASTHHGVEAVPIVVDGVMYVTAPWDIVYALDARTGKKRWRFDPDVPGKIGYKGCCDVVSRGVAVYKGRVYVATFDGRLIALDAATGKPAWTVDTLPSGNHNYTISGAPLAVDGKIIIGNGGAEYFGVRGYVSAYDAKTGKLDWRWYTVPGDPAKPYENDAMAAASKTWDPATKYWTKGGGGTVWNGFSYDPKLGLVYFGTGNANPWNREQRGGGQWSGLYTTSIVALHVASGKYAWSYQTTIADPSDYDADQDLILASLKIHGKPVPVIMQANKNGFFFVLDRRDGEFISADNFVPVNWAKGYDKHGKPIETDLFASGKPFDSIPGPFGGHNWQPMSFSPLTGLAYIPAQHIPVSLSPIAPEDKNSKRAGGFMSGNGWNLGMLLNAVPPKSTPFGRLIAWNPVTQKEANSPPPGSCSRRLPVRSGTAGPTNPARRSAPRTSAPSSPRTAGFR